MISTKLYAGRTVAHVYGDSSPGPDFEPVKPDLEDVYFSLQDDGGRSTVEGMKFREIFRFEFVYQARRVRTWLYFAVLFVVAYLLTRSAIDARVMAANSSIRHTPLPPPRSSAACSGC